MPALHETTVKLASGIEVITFSPYAHGDAGGVVALAVASGISLTSVVLLLILIAAMAVRSVGTQSGQLVFIRTHVAAYFVCLLFSDFVQSIGSLMSIRWVAEGGPSIGTVCTMQGAIKNGGNVGTAAWSLVISIHTFCILFLGRRPWEPALYATLFGVWTLIGFVVVLGPGVIETTARGPYFGISGLWCWITSGYQVERLMLEYLWMFSSAFISLILYTLVFLKLRGYLVVSGWTVNFRRKGKQQRWDPRAGRGSLEAQLASISKQMMLYPLAYMILILPIAACRYAAWAGHEVPFQATIFSDFVFLLSGFVNTALFLCTRRILPTEFGGVFSYIVRGRRPGSSDVETRTTTATSQLQGRSLGSSIEKTPDSPLTPPSPPPKEQPASTVGSPGPQTALLHPVAAAMSPGVRSAAPLLPAGAALSPQPSAVVQYAVPVAVRVVTIGRPPVAPTHSRSPSAQSDGSARSDGSTSPLVHSLRPPPRPQGAPRTPGGPRSQPATPRRENVI